jgi:hypothetical protein
VGPVVVSGLLGAPIAEHFIGYSPAQTLLAATGCAVQIVLAGKEELFEPGPSSRCSRNCMLKTWRSFPEIGHYDIYGKARDEADRLAIAWFDKNLKQ